MKNRYSSTLIIFLSIMCFEFCQSIQLAKAEEYKKNQDLIKKSFYTNGYTFEES